MQRKAVFLTRKHSISSSKLFVSTGLLLLLAILFLPNAIQAMKADNGPAAAWERARLSGAYSFTTGVRQTTTPKATVFNVGRASKTQTMHLEGETSLPDQSLHLILWPQGGSVLNPNTGIEIKVEGENAFARKGAAGDWQPINNFTNLYAPQGDFLAFLAAAKDIREISADSDNKQVSKYAFTIDGPAYAAYLRDQMEAQLLAKGELPPGIKLSLSDTYKQMTGDGELWIDAGGLPVRQILRLNLPDTPDDQQISAEVTTDFSNFAPLPPTMASVGMGEWANMRMGEFLPFTIHHSPFTIYHFVLAAFLTGLILLAIRHRHSKKLYAILAITVILSMVVTPLLQGVHAANFTARQQAKADAQTERQQESEMQQTLRSVLTKSDHNPNLNPLNGEWRIANDDVSPVRKSANSPFANSNEECDPDDPADSDDDGLTGGNECVLGTNPDVEDSDGDGISDGEEIAGFEYNGKTWYSDPLEIDSNSDGIGDGQEWNAGRAEGDPPPDNDNDGTPDLFDRDNDGDGVPDRLDLSPWYKGDKTFTSDDPFQLIVSDLEAGMPTFVEFQLRPVNPDHLWYAFNVLDWPKGDLQGQIQDEDGATFYDVDNDTGRNPNDNGDMKLVPMLEIKISGDPDNLPPQEDLDPYGVFVQDLDDNGENKAVYVPLQLVTNNKGGEHVAFSGKMRYLPAETWGNAQQVRLVWLVKALVDECKTYEDNRCTEYKEMNKVQIIHSYGDDWFLTGLSAREDHGVDYDVIYEDPAVDDDVDDDSTLLYLTYGLEKTFIVGSDCEDIDDKGTADPADDECLGGDGERDVTVSEIYRRWNYATNAAVSDEQRWNLDDRLTVVTHTYQTADQGMATLAMTDTKTILEDHFTVVTPVTPTLLFAREERSRNANLDLSLDDDNGIIQWSDDNSNQLTLNLNQDDAPLELMAGINWAPYRYKDGEWQAYPIEEYWDELHERYTAAFANEFDDDDDPVAARGGAVIVGQMHYMAVYVGVSNLVQSGEKLLTVKRYQSFDKPLGASFANAGKIAVLYIVNIIIMWSFYRSSEAVKALYEFMQMQKFSGKNVSTIDNLINRWRNIKGFFTKWRSGAIGNGKFSLGLLKVVVILAVIAVALYFIIKYYAAGNMGAKIAAAVIVGAALFWFTILTPILQLYTIAKAIQSAAAAAGKAISGASALGQALSKTSRLVGISRAVVVIGLIIAVGIVWGVFIYAVVTEDIPANSVAFDMLLAQTIAATILAILQFALALTIVGAILVAIVALIDIVLIILGNDWTLSRWMTDVITKAIFSYELAINVDDDDLITMGKFGSAIVHPEMGMVAGNQMEFSIPITTNIKHLDPTDWRTKFYLWKYSKNQLRSTTFKFELSPDGREFSAGLNNMTDLWRVSTRPGTKWGHTMYQAWEQSDLSTVSALEAGVNKQVNLKLASAYAIPGVECWTLVIIIPWPPIYLPIPVCFDKEVEGYGNDDVGPIIFDVLPPTLDEFVDVATWANGMKFRDSDGDGLLSQTYNGNDPDDTQWDTDGDGLSDGWEMEMSSIPAGEGGYFFDPRNSDTDGDGLSDQDEVYLATNPNNPDSDGDTISDYAEAVDGWTFTYAEGKSLQIYSDPLAADSDGDGMSDLFERTLHTCPSCDPLENRYHPDVWNNSPIGLYAEVGEEDGIVRPEQVFPFTTTVDNNLKPNLWVRGATDLSADPLTGGPMTMFFDIAREEQQNLYSNLSAPAGTGDGDIVLTTTMEAQLHTPSVWAWDPRQSDSTGVTAELDGAAIAAVDGWTSPYALAALENDRVRVYSATVDGLSGGGVLALGESGDASNAPPDIVCNDDGICLTVWAAQNGGTHSLRYRRILPTAELTGSVESIAAGSGNETAGGAVAGDGSAFTVVWLSGSAGNWTLNAAQINQYGVVSSPTLILDSGDIGGADIAYAFDRYQVVWTNGGELKIAEISGSQVTNYELQVTNVSEVTIAYDPLSHQSLIAYRYTTGNSSPYLRARVFAGGKLGDKIHLMNSGAVSAQMNPAASADPANGGWIVAWRLEGGGSSIRYQAIGMNGGLRGTQQLLVAGEYTPVLDLACAEPRPVVQLLFDEETGVADFSDNSGYGNDGFCVDDSNYDCPASGVGGKNGNAAQFDGDKDTVFVPLDVSETSYALTLWFKASCQSCGLFEMSNKWRPGVTAYNADRSLYLNSRGEMCARLGNRFDGNSSETVCSSGKNYNDGAWHQAAYTFGGAVGGQELYVDGELVAVGEQDFSDLNLDGQRLRIGYGEYQYGGYFTGVIDEVTLYDRALSGGEIGDAYRAPLLVYPFDEPEGATNFENAARNGYGGTCDGDDCPTSGVGGRAYAAAQFRNGDVIATADRSVAQAEYFYDFNNGVPTSVWNQNDWSHSPTGNRAFLGRFGNETAALNLSGLPPHDQIEVQFDLYIIDTWDGNNTGPGPDYWEWWADGARQLRTTFSNNSGSSQSYPDEYKANHERFTGAAESATLGYSRDSVYHLKKSFSHINNSLQLDFKALGLESLNNESWGLDNVRVRVINNNVPLANSSFTAAFWVKRDRKTREYRILTQGDGGANADLFIGFNSDKKAVCAFDDSNKLVSPTYNDSGWRHWACVYDKAANTRTLYRDGEQVAQDTPSSVYQGSGTLDIGEGSNWYGLSFANRLDELAVWREALSAEEIKTLYQKVKAQDDSVTVCALPRAAQGEATLTLNRLGLRETTTLLGEMKQERTDTVTVDATDPNSSITSLVDGARLNITGTLIIGGEARDNTYVAWVEISVDGGAWEKAEGAETWSYAWDTSALSEGNHTIRSRAADAGGNESTPDSITVNIDRTPPALTADPPPLKADEDGNGGWLVSLSGVITDANPGTVEVLLQGSDGTAAGLGWQQATLQSFGTVWQINYALNNFDNNQNAHPEPTGVYTLTLRAEDLAGNLTAEAAYPPTVDLDNTAPETALTFPYTGTAVLTDTACYITGVVTDAGAVSNGGVAGVEIAFVNSEAPVVNWNNALLATPGSLTSTWVYTLPSPVEGFYQIYLRGSDAVGNVNQYQSTWQQWQGLVDTQDPYVDALIDYGVMGTLAVGVTDVVTYSESTCLARDLTLDVTQFNGCPCDKSTWRFTTYDEVSPWYANTFSDTTKLYQIDANCLDLGEFITPPTVSAKDAAKRYSQTMMTETVSVRLLDSAVLTPTDGVVFTTTNAFNVETRAVAAPWGVGAITITINSIVWQANTYGGGLAAHQVDNFNPATYNPPGDGRYRFLSVVRELNNPGGNKEQTLLHPVTITVDSLPPSTPTFSDTVITTSDRLADGSIFLTGVVTDIVGVAKVETNRDSEGWVRAAHDGEVWRSRWTHDDSQSDNVTYTVSVRAIDLVDRVSPATQTVTFDMVPPEPVTMSLTYQEETFPFGVQPIIAPQIVTNSHILNLEWTPSSDGAGVRGYRAGYSVNFTDTTGLTFTAHSGAAAYSQTQTVAEASTLFAHVVSIDNNGNEQAQEQGPIYVDAPTTPDIIGATHFQSASHLSYHGWMDSGCSLQGVDRRSDFHAPTGAALTETQKFYTTWNSDPSTGSEQALRMAWEGANWDYEGDLFIYLDTITGSGATTLYNPYGSPTGTIYLPGNFPALDTTGWYTYQKVYQTQMITPLLEQAMAADYLVWAQSALTATLMSWNGSAWVTDTVLSNEEYAVSNVRRPAVSGQPSVITDFALPFASIGITHPLTVTLNLLAVASEDDSLRLWATMPQRNLVSSRLAVNPLGASLGGEGDFVLARAYRWYGLGSGVCPNDPLNALLGEDFPDADLRASISVEPVGVTLSLIGDDLYHQWKKLFQGQTPASRYFDFLDHDHPPVGQGDILTYTISIQNRGTVTAENVQAFAGGYYALHLPGGVQDPAGYREYQVITMGNIASGATVTRAITGVIEVESNWRYTQCIAVESVDACRPLKEWAALDATLFDSRFPLTPTIGLIVPEDAPLEWLWADNPVDLDPPSPVGIDAPIATVRPATNTIAGYAADPSGVYTVEVQIRDALSSTTSLICPDETPHDGRWDCAWNNISGSDGDEFDLRARATDRYNHVSAWTSPWRTVVLDSTPPTVTVTAEAREAVDGQLIGVEGYRLSGAFTDSHSLGDVEICYDAVDGVECNPATILLSSQAPTGTTRLYDDVPSTPVSIGTNCLTRTFTISENFFIGDVDLGLTVEHPHREELVATLFSPAGTSVRAIFGGGNNANIYANYDVWLDDAAPNGLHNKADDDNTAAPWFERPARPDAALNIFNGEVSTGTWTLRLCDLLPLVNNGWYSRGQLALTPQSNALSSAGTWMYNLPTPQKMDSVSQTVRIYGLDALGNRAANPITLSYTLDTVAPVFTLTGLITEMPQTDPTPIFSGTVSDGGNPSTGSGQSLDGVYLRVDPPDGASYRDSAAVDGGDWIYTPHPTVTGAYTYWLEVYDMAGNVSVSTPYTVTAYDSIPPEVSAYSPANGAISVTLTAPVVITFSEAISAATLSYTVTPDPGGWAQAWNGAGEVVTLTHANFATKTTYTVTVTDAEDLAGNPLTDAPVVWAFTTISVTEVITPPAAAFVAWPLAGQPPLTVVFTDASTGQIDAWQWDFGDGAMNAAQHPTHTYALTGTFAVSLTVSNLGGSDSEVKNDYIIVSDNPVIANFTAEPTGGEAPLTVVFTDASVGDITSWQWNFGDGASDNVQHPEHLYQNAGVYTVSLAVSGPGGSDVEVKSNYIAVSQKIYPVYLPLILK